MVSMTKPSKQRSRPFRNTQSLIVALLSFYLSIGLFLLALFSAWMLLVEKQHVYENYFFGSLFLFACLWVFRFFYTSSIRCLVCHGQVLQNKSCNKHVKARKLPLLNYHHTTFVDMTFRGEFCCMYCGTRYRLGR